MTKLHNKYSLLLLILLSGCSFLILKTKAPVKKDFANEIFAKGIYQNKIIGLSLNFGEHWRAIIQAEKFPADYAEFAEKIQDQGGELLMIAEEMPEGVNSAQIIAEPTNIALQEYFQLIKDLNKGDYVNSKHSTVLINQTSMIKWQYTTNSPEDEYVYLDYILKQGKYNLRISFWAYREMQSALEKQADQILKTLKLSATE